MADRGVQARFAEASRTGRELIREGEDALLARFHRWWRRASHGVTRRVTDEEVVALFREAEDRRRQGEAE